MGGFHCRRPVATGRRRRPKAVSQAIMSADCLYT